MTAAAAALAVLLAAAAAPVRVPLRASVRLDVPGAIAAYPVDARVAGAEAVSGGVVLRGRDAGTTHVTIVDATGRVEVLLVVVERPPRRAAAAATRAVAATRTSFQTQYDSALGRVTTALEHHRADGSRAARLELLNVSRLTGPRTEDAASAMARASLEVRDAGWRAVLLDARVDHSPLSVEGATLRGAHLSAGPLEVHAGYTSPQWYRGFLLPGEREAAVGASYRLSLGSGETIGPIVYRFGEAARRGTMASLLYERASPASPLHVRAEAGWGGAPGGALRLTLNGDAARLDVDGRHVPAGFASLRSGRGPGSSADALASARVSRSMELLATGSVRREELPALARRRASGSLEARWSLAPGWTMSGGVTRSRADAGGAPLDTVTAPFALAWRGGASGVSALYRYRHNSLLDRGGHGGRIQTTLRLGGLRAGAYVDGQQADATLELLFRESPELARLFAEVGLEARTPEDAERLLRDEPALAGQLVGVTFALRPWRLVAGGDLSWSSRDPSRQELRANVLVERSRTTRRLEHGGTATLWYGRRLAGPCDVFGSAAAWSRGTSGLAEGGWSWTAGIRIAFDGAPRLPWPASGALEGRVFLDDAGRGRWGPGSAAEAGARVRLDGERETVTGPEGRFRFEGVSRDDHRVELVLPMAPGTFFTTPAVVTARPGEVVEFGVARMAAKVVGALRNDGGAGVAGVRVLLSGAETTLSATTDSSGRFTIEGLEGTYVLAVDAASLPPGYDLAGLRARDVRLVRDAPAQEDLTVPAFRSVSGTVRGKDVSGTLVWLVERHVKRAVGADGRYVFRGLAPGRYTIAVHVGDGFVRRVVEVPAGPAVIRDVDFGEAR